MVEKSPEAFRTISEAADELDLPQHVLRFWETRFSTIKPLKRGGGRRYYRPEDVLLLKGIRHLLYDQGFTIKGVQRILKDNGVRHVMAIAEGGIIDETIPTAGEAPDYDDALDGDEAFVESEISEVEDSEPAMTRRAPALAAPSRSLDEADRERLSSVLRELLDCKRILERAREN